MADANSLQEYHKKFAVDLFNQTWQFLEMENRSEDDDEKMLQGAYASCYHWREVGTALHQARGEWMISHVNAVLGRSAAALHHAKRTLILCDKNGFGDFDLAFAYEAMARALAACEDCSGYLKYFTLAQQAGEKIGKKEDKDVFSESLNAGPWFGVR
jgi:hypothetical protein